MGRDSSVGIATRDGLDNVVYELWTAVRTVSQCCVRTMDSSTYGVTMLCTNCGQQYVRYHQRRRLGVASWATAPGPALKT
jgi:predicted RNA-binding Zn-ribbon protein involved in translation (DUF1610 family)